MPGIVQRPISVERTDADIDREIGAELLRLAVVREQLAGIITRLEQLQRQRGTR